MTSQLTRPFNIIHNENQSVKDKFLAGQPFKNDYPGPFKGISAKGIDDYIKEQRSAVNYYDKIAEYPLEENPNIDSVFNGPGPICENQGSRIPMFPPVHQRNAAGFKNEEGIEKGQFINRQSNTSESFSPALQTVFSKPFHPNQYHHDRIENANSIENFVDNSMTNPENLTGFGSIVPKFIETPGGGYTKCSSENTPLLDIYNRPVDQFSHNNMVPYYGSNVTQNMSVTGVPQAGDNNTCNGVTNGFSNATPFRSKLELYTGSDEMYMHKRETGAMFSPAEQQTGWVFGTPAFRPDLDRFKTQVWKRHGETPVESIKVGPGIGLDYTIPAQGGFQQFTRILPNNVSDYKANQLEGRVKAGKWAINHPTSQYIHGVNKNTADLTITQARRPTQPTKFYTNAESAGPTGITDYIQSVEKGKQNREDTESAAGFGQFNLQEYIYDGSGNKIKKENFQSGPGKRLPCVEFSSAPVGMTMGSLVPQASQERNSYTNIRETFKRGTMDCLDKPQGTNEWGIIMGPARGNPVAGSRDGKYINYTDRGDVNPYVINVTGTQSGGLWNPNSYQQAARVTRKETIQYSDTGNISTSNKSITQNLWSDEPRVTTKETTTYSNTGNIQSDKAGFYTNVWEENKPKVTRKETTNYSNTGNIQAKNPALMDRSMYTGNFIKTN